MKKRTLLSLAVVVLAVAILLSVVHVGAVWDESKATHVVAAEIENATLIIGSHLIHLSSLTQTVYEAAQLSAEESGQTEIFYKSELADGAWFNITTASTLADITTAGQPVAAEIIEGLFLTHHTKSDGITYDLRTGQPVALSDLRDPYDLESMEELFPLATHLKTMEETESDTDDGPVKIMRLTAFFATEVENAATQALDSQLTALQAYHDGTVAPRGDAKEKDVLQGVIDIVDATRRAEVMTTLDRELEAYTLELYGSIPQTAGGGGEDDEEEDEDKIFDVNLQSAANDSLSNVKNSLITYQGKMLDSGTTVLSQHRFEVINRLIADAEAGNTPACDADLYDLISLDNILASVVGDQQNELALLEGSLLSTATGRYTAGLSAGESAEYRSADTDSLKRGLARDYASTVNTYRGELEFLIDAKCLRVPKEEGLTYITGLLEEVRGGYHGLVPDDGFRYNVSQSVDDHITFLERKRRELELDTGGNELDQLILEKNDLQSQLMAALDQNDLLGAQEIQNKLEELDAQIQSLGADPEYASEGTTGGLIADLKNQAMEAIKNGDAQGAADILDSLSELMELNGALAFPALSDIRSAMVEKRDLDGDASFEEAIAQAEQAILDNKELFDANMRDDKTAADLSAIAGDFFDGSLTGAGVGVGDNTAGDVTALNSDSQGVVFILALELYQQETGSAEAGRLMRSEAQRQLSLGSPLVFNRIDDGGNEYLPCTAIAEYLGMRYVWNQNKNEAALALGGGYYLFTIYSTEVRRDRDGEQTETMTAPAKYQNGAHVPESYTREGLGVEAFYIPGTSLGALSSEELAAYADQLFGLFMS